MRDPSGASTSWLKRWDSHQSSPSFFIFVREKNWWRFPPSSQKMEEKDWWEAERTALSVRVHERLIDPVPPAFRFANICEINMDETGFRITNEFLKCFPVGTLRRMSFVGCRVDPGGVDFSGLTSLQTIDLSDCSMRAGCGEYVFPGSLERIRLDGNNLVDLSRLKIRPVPPPPHALFLSLEGNPIRSMADLDVSFYGCVESLYLVACGMVDMGGWVPPASCVHIDLRDNGLEELPDYMHGRGACWTNFSGNPIGDIRGLCDSGRAHDFVFTFNRSNFRGCPLEPIGAKGCLTPCKK